MAPYNGFGQTACWKDAQVVLDVLAKGRAQTLDDVAAALDGTCCYARAVLAVGRLLLDGKLSIMETGHVELCSQKGCATRDVMARDHDRSDTVLMSNGPGASRVTTARRRGDFR